MLCFSDISFTKLYLAYCNIRISIIIARLPRQSNNGSDIRLQTHFSYYYYQPLADEKVDSQGNPMMVLISRDTSKEACIGGNIIACIK